MYPQICGNAFSYCSVFKEGCRRCRVENRFATIHCLTKIIRLNTFLYDTSHFKLYLFLRWAAAIICWSIGPAPHFLGSHFICASPPHLKLQKSIINTRYIFYSKYWYLLAFHAWRAWVKNLFACRICFSLNKTSSFSGSSFVGVNEVWR